MTREPQTSARPARRAARPKVTIDIAPLFEYQWTGIPVFTRRLVKALLAHGGMDLRFMFQLTDIPPEPVMAAISAGTGAFLRQAFEDGGSLNARAADTGGRFLYPSVKTSFGLAKSEASTVHDMTTLLMPEFHVEANIAWHLDHLVKSIATDDAVFCISEATRIAFLSAFPSASGKVRMLPQYVDWPETFPIIERNLPRLALGRYAVVVGTLEPRKNLDLLLKAMNAPELRDSDFRFVVIGGMGWKMDAFLADIPDSVRDRIKFSGFVTEFTKYRLINEAEFLIFPSIYEGFGIPALEAMSLGKPVLASWSSSLPEVIGDAGIYFDPFSVTDFAAAFATISHPVRLAELTPRAIARNAEFSWRRMAASVAVWADGR